MRSPLSPRFPRLNNTTLTRLDLQYRTHKVVYRKYAGLYFTLCVDVDDNELACLELIHLFVEILDHYFNYVKEIHLVYNFHKVFVILDELVLSGEPQESSKKVGKKAATLATCRHALTP